MDDKIAIRRRVVMSIGVIAFHRPNHKNRRQDTHVGRRKNLGDRLVSDILYGE